MDHLAITCDQRDDTDEGFAINVRPTVDPAIEVRIDPIYIDNFDELFALPDIRILEIDYWPQDNQIMVTTLNNGIPAMHRILLPTLEDTDRWELPIGPESEPDSFQIDLSKSGDPNAGYVSPIVVTNFSQGMIHMYNFRGDLISSFTTDQSPVGFANSAAEFITVPAGPARTYTRWDVQTGTEIETVTLSPESEIIYSADTGDVFSLYTAFNSDSGGNQYDSAAITIYDPEDGASYQTLDVPPPASESNPGGWQATGLTQNYFVAAAFFMQNDSEGELRIYRRQDDALVSDEPITGFTSVYEPVFLDPIYSVLMLLDGNEVIVLDPDSQEVLYQTTFSEPYDGFTYANRNDNYEIMFYAKEDDPYSPMRPVGYLIGRGSEFRED
jgi:hypothetical protein